MLASSAAACSAAASWSASVRPVAAAVEGAEVRNNRGRTTKVILPKKKPLKWSTGVAPGEYGGPPTVSKPRKYWGEGDKDPLSSTDDYIWNKNFVPSLRRLLDDEEDNQHLASIPFQKDPGSGFLCLNRSLQLDSVETDLSRELAAPPKPVLELQVEAARRGSSAAVESLSNAQSPKWRLAPTKRELEKWDRAKKASVGGSDAIRRESTKNRGDPEALAAESREKYFKLKEKLQLLTVGIGGVGVLSSYFCYSSEIAISFGAGLLGSLTYIRMLGNSVDSLANGGKGLVKGAAAQPRLLVPVLLVMVYNRWNELLVPQHGFMQLELVPMLVGFFTYKVATFVQTIEESLVGFGNEGNSRT